jgi:hypothetical protein
MRLLLAVPGKHGHGSVIGAVRPRARAASSAGAGAPLPRGWGPVDCPDRGATWSLAGDGQGLLPRLTGEKARAVKARYAGLCRGCGAYTQARNGKGDAYAYCKACHPGAIQRRWSRERLLEAMGEWLDRYGRLPSSYDWSRTHARRRGGAAVERLAAREWPPASVVTSLFGGSGLSRRPGHRAFASLRGFTDADGSFGLETRRAWAGPLTTTSEGQWWSMTGVLVSNPEKAGRTPCTKRGAPP